VPDIISTAVIQRDDAIDQPVVARTPSSVVADVRVQTMSIAYAVFVRCARVYVQGVLGFATAGGLGLNIGLEAHEAGHLLTRAATLAIAPVAFTFLQNVVELLTRLDESLPRLRA
jgi:hypothetical protein